MLLRGSVLNQRTIMKMKQLFAVAVALCTLHSALCTAEAQSTAFTYQGQLHNGGNPANGPSAAACLALLILWWNREGRLRPVFFSFAYFLAALLPVLGLVDQYFWRYSFVGDHFQYLASMGPLALAAAAITTSLGFPWKGRPVLAPLLCGLLLLVLAAL